MLTYNALCLQSNPLAHLDLIDYACQDLMISFAVGNKDAALSNFSPTTNMTVDIRGKCTLSNRWHGGLELLIRASSYQTVMSQFLIHGKCLYFQLDLTTIAIDKSSVYTNYYLCT